MGAFLAASASRPPLMADRCLRMALISSIEAPQRTSSRFNSVISSSETVSSSGFSTSAEPPPEITKNTSVFSSASPSVSRMASAAARLRRSG